MNILIMDEKVSNSFALEVMPGNPDPEFIPVTKGKEVLKTVFNEDKG